MRAICTQCLLVLGVAVILPSIQAAQNQAPRLVRSLSGPSGTLKESRFVMDETRNRFVFPQDRTLTVYFEWEHQPGDHVLTATWRQPDGRVASVSPDVKISTSSRDLACYWIFTIDQRSPVGAWTVEIRIDGQPAGSHAFELAGVDGREVKFTLDQVATTYGPSVVRIRKLDATGRRLDTSSGFVVAQDTLATSLQSIDSASALEIEFADGSRTLAQGVLAASRPNDWALIAAPTGTKPAIPIGTQPVPVGSRLAAFSFSGDTRVILPVSVGGVGGSAPYAPRIRFSPEVSGEAIGGPLIDESGNAVGILGGSLTPGARPGHFLMSSNPWLWSWQPSGNSATTISELPKQMPAIARSFADARGTGWLTPPVEPLLELVGAGTTTSVPKDPANKLIHDRSEFSARDHKEILVYSFWKKQAKLSRGEVSATLSNVANEVRAQATPKRVSLGDRELRSVLAWPTAGLAPGYYRIDLQWNGTVVWRTYVRVVE